MLADQGAGRSLKGEIVIVVGPAEPQVVSDDAISVRLDEVLGEMSLKDAAKTVASELGVPKSRVYALGVKAKDENP
jgi:16S rRNA (cytidine1402-2'-O)-methyltransferase